MAVPGLLYTLQNNLYFVGVSNLSVSVFQVVSQLKIVTTAICSVLLLRRQMSVEKWSAVVLLTLGVMLIVSRGEGNKSRGIMTVGLAAVTFGCVTSGVAGVFLEKMLKDSTATIWERNLQLSMFGVFFGLFGVFTDLEAVKAGGFFQGYNNLVIVVVVLQAVGGLVVAAVLKYADNVIKCFAVAVSVILGVVASRLLHSEGPELTDPLFICGGVAIIWAMLLYSVGSEKLLSIAGVIAVDANRLPISVSQNNVLLPLTPLSTGDPPKGGHVLP
jgi:UDP-sugar transporter A1/2/3